MNNLFRKMLTFMRQREYEVYTQPFQLNIVGVRSESTRADQFDDWIFVFYKNEKGNWQLHSFPATTDPGTYWLENPMQERGTAILAEGQYVNAYAIGLHRGEYEALRQIHAPVTIIRDYDRNAVLDFMNGSTDSGMFGINIHRARVVGLTTEVGKWSAGCQVLANGEDFITFMRLCETHRSLHDNYFTYTLIDLRAIARTGKRHWLYAGIAGLAGLTALSLTFAATQKDESENELIE
jgi:hypothetical protein